MPACGVINTHRNEMTNKLALQLCKITWKDLMSSNELR